MLIPMIEMMTSFIFALLSGYLILNIFLDTKKMGIIEKITLSMALSISFYSVFLFIINVHLGIPVSIITLFITLILLFALFQSKIFIS